MCFAWPRSPHPVLGQRADRNHCAEVQYQRGDAWQQAHGGRASALPHNSSRSSSLQMQALLWLFMKGRQPRVQTALNTVSAMDSQAAEKEKIRQVSNRHSGTSEGWVEAP